ncbi:MAG TPA: hypothetical protein VGL48_04900 [Acidimicrobiales bacterium]|jgi:mannose-6-phosphate isomerase-like protein (cupin superfamily)
MSTIKFVRSEQRHFVSVAEQCDSDPKIREIVERMPSGESQGSSFVHHQGNSDEPQLFEVRIPPDTHVEPHAHEVDEIIVVTEGEAHFGKQVYSAGSSVFIPKLTLYSFRSGPAGLTFLNFRPVHSGPENVIFKDEFLAHRHD